MQNLLPDAPPTLLPDDAAAAAALSKARAAGDPASVKAVAADHPTYSAAWGRLAEWALAEGETVTAYAFEPTSDSSTMSRWRTSALHTSWRAEAAKGIAACVTLLPPSGFSS